jgi:anthranilate synthase component 1
VSADAAPQLSRAGVARIELDRRVDAAAVFAELAAQHPHVFWLDAGPAASHGWSYLGAGRAASAAEVRGVDASAAPRREPGSPAFVTGWVGWLGYEGGAARAGAPVAPADAAAPADRWLRVDAVIAIDHATGRAWAAGEGQVAARLASAWNRAGDAPPAVPASPVRTATARHAPSGYAELVERCRDSIREGDAYQLCLTTRFAIEGEVDPVAAFSRLRRDAPSHHGGIVRAGEEALVSASPERFLEIDGGLARTHPIKGTRRREADPGVDAALAAELRADPKERAENVMIVDLMRNDLSRVSEPGTVAVERLLEVESYPTVHQLVSTVSGRLRPGATIGDVLDAAFPAGSMTGAPKLSAMTILHDLEGADRGVFAGCFGWVGDDGAADLAMVIRSIVTFPGGAYVGAGGGITWLSRPDAEVAEVALKARAPLAAAGAALPADWAR